MEANVTGDRGASRIRAASRVAVVLGIFTLAVAVALVINDRRTRFSDPLESPALAGRKEALLEAPRDDALKEEIREIDRDLRAEYFRRQAFASRGGYLLVLGLAGFVIAVRLAGAWRARPPEPKPSPSFLERRMRDAARARWSVGTLGLVLAAGAAIWSTAWTSGCYVEMVDVAAEGGSGADPKAGKVAAAKASGDLPPPSREEARKHWPRFRGPGGLGISAYANVPSSWNGATGENILWKAPIALPGENSAIVWGDRVFVTGANEDAREVYCYDAASGAILWTRLVETPSSKPPTPVEPLDATGFAAPTAVTDGRFVCAIFANGDIACFDVEGKPVWSRNLGAPMENVYGHGASLLMHGDLLLVPYDQGIDEDGLSRLYALNVRTGKPVWEVKRPVGASWSTPIIVEIDASAGLQLITAADPFAIAYDPETGTEIWRASVLKGDVASSPIFGDGLVYTVTVDTELCAIKPDGKGDVTETHVLWKGEDGLPDIASPLTDGKLVWLLPTDGFLVCYDAKTGKKIYEQEIDARFSSSPSLAGDRLYLLDTKGVMRIISAGPEYREIGTAELGEKTNACPAFLDGRIYIRGKENLYAIGGTTS
ncbi:MAG: PQQ-like beta-propeller repeat protein [Planctomycetes bacterium]|nr:PQQ-like beta-propeller repeat protein [Planctomycetota bacterium]